MRIFWAAIEAIGGAAIATFLWSIDQLGVAAIASARGFTRWVRRALFGNWRRTAVTLVCIALIAVHYYPSAATPIVQPLLTIAVVLFGIRVMFHPYFPIGGRRRRRRQN